MNNTTKSWRKLMKRTLFSYATVIFNGISYGKVNSKNIGKYFAMYRLNRAMKKKKAKAQELMQQVAGIEESAMRSELAKFIANFAKLQREADAFEFLDARRKGETMADKVLATLTGSVEATLALNTYINAGINIVSPYISKIKEIAFNIVKQHGKVREHYLSKEELNGYLRSKMRSESVWRVEAFVE